MVGFRSLPAVWVSQVLAIAGLASAVETKKPYYLPSYESSLSSGFAAPYGAGVSIDLICTLCLARFCAGFVASTIESLPCLASICGTGCGPWS